MWVCYLLLLFFFKSISQINNFHCVSANGCTTGIITRVTISDETFTLNYDTNQFNACLSVQVVKDNLASLTDVVDQDEQSMIILSKLREVRDREIQENVFCDAGSAVNEKHLL